MKTRLLRKLRKRFVIYFMKGNPESPYDVVDLKGSKISYESFKTLKQARHYRATKIQYAAIMKYGKPKKID